MSDYETEARRVRELARTEAYHRGPELTLMTVARHVPHLRLQFVIDQCELAGFPVRVSKPGKA